MAGPITWKNVNIDNGSSAAAFGSNAANFGRSAVQGLDIFSQQMDDRIVREDERLTNEAIAQALSGGPQVAGNRRVDAEKLQLAVERDALGNRQERALTDDLLTSSVNRRLTGAQADKAVKDVDTYDARWKLDQEIAKANAAYQKSQSQIEKTKLDMLLAEKAKAEKNENAILGINKRLFGPEAEAERVKNFEAWYAQNREPDATPEDDQIIREQFLQTARDAVYTDPEIIDKLAVEYGVPAQVIYKGSAVGERAWNQQVATQEQLTEEAVARKEIRKEVMQQAENFSNGDRGAVRWNGSEIVWGLGDKVTDDVEQATYSRLGVDATSKEGKAKADELGAYIKSKFTDASMFDYVASQVAKDGKIPAKRTSDGNGYEQVIDRLAAQVKQKAKDESTLQFDSVSSSGDPITDALNYNKTIRQRTAERKEETPENGTDSVSQSAVSEEEIRGINTNPATKDERDEALNTLNRAVEELLGAKKSIKLPENPSYELQQLHKMFEYQVDVANKGMFVPNQPADVAIRTGKANRAVTPKFPDRKQHAADARQSLKLLLAKIEQERQAAIADELRLSLD